jgi:putative ABC transport system permease protein
MKLIQNISGLFLTSMRRLVAYKGTAFASFFGLTLAISLILSISIYSDGVYYTTFLENVAKTRENSENQLSLDDPTFAFLFHYFGGWHGSKNWDELASLDTYFVEDGIDTLGIPVVDFVRLFSSDTFHLFPKDESNSINRLSLSRTSFGTMSDLEAHSTIVDGRMPTAQPNMGDQSVEVLVNQNLANEASLEVGETYIAYVDVQNDSGKKETTQIPVQIVGIWRADDPGDDYWIFSPSAYERILFVPEDTFFYRLTAHIPALVYNAYWYLIMDAEYVHADEVNGLLNRVDRLERGANELQKNLWLSISPKEALKQYADEARILRILLYAFSIPVIGLILAFTGMVTRLSTDQRRGEIAVLRSRGGSQSLLLGVTAIEGFIIGCLSYGLSLPIAKRITQSIYQTSGFLVFSNPSDLRIGISSGVWQIGVFCVAAFVFMLLLPTYRATKDTILIYKLERGRIGKSPNWQRYWLDILLLIPAVYGTYLLRQQGSLVLLTGDNPADPFQNPLLFLVPSLGILALSLFSLRLIRPVMALIDRTGSLTTRVSVTMAARNISRSPGNYFTPLLILILTMSLFAYTASLSTTLDRALVDRAYYQVGADARFFDPGDSTVTEGSTWWDFFPVSEYGQSPGITNAARLGRYATNTSVGRFDGDGIFFGIDRLDFPQVSYWRDDFSEYSLGELMNILATDPENILVNREFLSENGLMIGDYVDVTVKTYDQYNDLTLKVAGIFDLFPGWYPEQGSLMVGNLSHLFEAAGGPVPYYVILQSENEMDPTQLAPSHLRALDGRVRPVDWDMPFYYIDEAQKAPERQGFLGFLFLGFATAVLLTVLAFFLHLIFTFRHRSIEIGVLRAAGLSTKQMIANLIWEFIFLILFGGGIGTALGYLASKVYIPYMQVGAETSELIPPFQVLIPWETITQIYWMFIGLFGFSLIISVFMLRRMKIFQAIKLGETV